MPPLQEPAPVNQSLLNAIFSIALTGVLLLELIGID